MSSLTIIY
jgi:carbohydrate ABC transporter substrate-binding protein, CUT1 family (TC 3.A.1.1.-)